MDTLLDILFFAVIAGLCWRGYQQRRSWLLVAVGLIWSLGRGYGLWRQVFHYAPVIVGWLLLCHWVNTHGWHGLAAGGILFAMTLALHAMRSWEEQQKQEKRQCNICE